MAPVVSRPFAPPVVNYRDSVSGSATASKTSATGREMRPETWNRTSESVVRGATTDSGASGSPIEDADDAVFKALASATRRRLVDHLEDGPKTTGALCAEVDTVDRCTVMQHLRVLEHAGLVVVERRGRERWNHLAAVPIKRIYDRWISGYAGPAVELLDRMERDLGPDGRAGDGI